MDAVVLAIVNCSLPRRIDAPCLRACLRGQEPTGPWLAHLTAFFGEVPIPALEAFAAEGGIAPADLRRGYEAVRRATGDRNPDLEDWLGYLEAPAP
jgi:hypothetical protein